MPYIKREQRERLERNQYPQNPGELNFLLTRICFAYLMRNESYRAYNDVLGVLEGCKLELYRQRIAPYEDKKMIENGDVYI